MTQKENSKFVTSLLLDVLPKKTYTRLAELGGRVPIPRVFRRTAYGLFSRLYDINKDEIGGDLSDYECFDDFFTRKLPSGCRDIKAHESLFISPSDSQVVSVAKVSQGAMFQAKGIFYSAEGLLGSKQLANEFEGGDVLTFYLRPRDYHRVHFPVSGMVDEVCNIPGCRYPVIPAAVKSVKGLYRKNERVVTVQSSSFLGRVATVMVAALGVGNVSLSWGAKGPVYTGENVDFSGLENIEVDAGDELGIFHLGSSVIVLFQRDKIELKDVDVGATVRLGDVLGERKA